MGTGIEYHRRNKELRRSAAKGGGDNPAVVDRTTQHPLNPYFDGSVKDKVERFFPEGTKFVIVALEPSPEGPSFAYDALAVNVAFGKPGSRRLKCLDIPNEGIEDSMPAILARHGINVGVGEDGKASPKLFKRLGRVFGTSHIGAYEDPDVYLVPDEKAPLAPTDGFSFIKKSVAEEATGLAFENFDAVQFSYIGPDYMAKGTGVIVHDLEHDLCVLGSHNCKREVSTLGASVLYIEQPFFAKPARTDVQTIVNNKWYYLFKRLTDDELDMLEALGGMVADIDAWHKDEYPPHDWHPIAKKKAERRGKEVPIQTIESALLEHGLHAGLSPAGRQSVFRAAAQLLKIDGFKVPYDPGASLRGYIVPDLTAFNRKGEFIGPQLNSLRKGQVGVGNHVREGNYLAYRQPNAKGEIVEVEAVPGAIWSRSLIQVNVYDCEEWLAKWGGADMDDAVVLVNEPEAWEQHHKNVEEMEKLQLPIPKLEDLIDQSVQAGSGDLTFRDQVDAVMTRPPVTLGQAVNFLMLLVMLEDWDVYRKAAACDTLEDLLDIYNNYHNPEEKKLPKYSDVFSYEDKNVRNGACRVPIEQFEGEDEGEEFEYLEVETIPTELGEVLKKASTRMRQLVEVDYAGEVLFQNTLLRTKGGIGWLKDKVNSEKDKEKLEDTKRHAKALWHLWRCLTYRPHVQVEGFDEFFQEAEEFMIERPPFFQRVACWNDMATFILSGRDDALSIVAGVGFYANKKQKMKDRATGDQVVRYGEDRLLWNLGTREHWVKLLKEFQNSLGLKSE